jgi:hypothetical protein
MTRRITDKVLRELINRINEDLEECEFDWRLKLYQTYGRSDVMKQFNGESGWYNITADTVITKKDLYNWLRGFQTGMWLEADHRR